MKREICAGVFVGILVVLITLNAYTVNKSSTELLNKIYALPSEYEFFSESDNREIETFKVKINEIVKDWEKFSHHLLYIIRYSDYEKMNSAVYSMRDSFSTKNIYDYLSSRSRLLISLERQKSNELPSLDNIF